MYAVYLDYEYDGTRNSVVLGGSIGNHKFEAMDFLELMSEGWNMVWEVDPEDLPAGYKFQTYYVAAYDPVQPALGMH